MSIITIKGEEDSHDRMMIIVETINVYPLEFGERSFMFGNTFGSRLSYGGAKGGKLELKLSDFRGGRCSIEGFFFIFIGGKGKNG